MKYRCPCCGYFTFAQQPDGSYDICPVCYWEDDAMPLEDPTFEGGANGVSLNEAKENFLKYGACTEKMARFTRPPKEDELAESNE